jgi:hypothetical protein
MKYICKIVLVLVISLALAPLPASSDPLAYPEHFRALGIPQLPGSKVIEVRLEGEVPVAVTLEREDTHRGVDVILYYGGGKSKTFEDVWFYDYDRSQSLEPEPDTSKMLFMNTLDGTYLLIKISPKGKMGSRVELMYPWMRPSVDLPRDWFLKGLDQEIDEE